MRALLINARLFNAIAAALLSGGILLWPTAGSAQDRVNNALVYELIDRINALERELRLLRNDFEEFQYRQRGGAANGGGGDYGALERRLSALEQALGTVGGAPRPDRNANADPDRAQAPYRPEQNDNRAAISGPDNGTDVEPPPIELIGPSGVVGNSSAAPAPAVEQEAYNAALNNLREGFYRDASQDFQAFLNAYPNSPLAADAHYWLGEAYYVNRDFDQAKQAYLTLGARYPQSDKLPDALLKLGYSYGELGERDRARQVLEKLIDAFPGTSAARRGEQYLAQLR